MDVGAVDDAVGLGELLPEGVVEGQGGDQFAGHRIPHDQLIRKPGDAVDGLGEAQPLEHPEDVGPELNPGADFAELGRLFEDDAPVALEGQGERRGQAADAAARDDDGFVEFSSHGAPPVWLEDSAGRRSDNADFGGVRPRELGEGSPPFPGFRGYRPYFNRR